MSYESYADLGGRPGHGRVVPEAEGEIFHATWEPRVLALTLAMGATGTWNIDMSRSARETLPGYAHLSYYQIWFAALLDLLAKQGLADADEIAAGHALRPAAAVRRVLHAADVAAVLCKGSPTVRVLEVPARFGIGDRVRTRALPVPHHTRLPGYARGKVGTVETVHGPHVFADAHAQGQGEAPQWLYRVGFDGRELWGDDAVPGQSVTLDAWESYLEPA